MDWLLCSVAVFGCLLTLGLLVEHRKYQQRNRQEIDQKYVAALKAHCIGSVDICKESLALGRRTKAGKKPFEVHRILHVAPDRWYLYIHVEDAEPLMTAISEQRAKTAITH